jgi:hypothetical protein
MRLRWLGIWAMLVCGQPLAADDAVKKVLLIGIDGCRTDALLAAHAPHLQRLGKTGALSLSNDVLGDRKGGADSVTLPGWASMLTGVWADKHGVRNNGHRNPLCSPHFSAAPGRAIPRPPRSRFFPFDRSPISSSATAMAPAWSSKGARTASIKPMTGAGSYDEVRRTFLIVSGPSSSQAAMPKKTANVDVAATALTHLGIAIRPEWRLDGQCVGLKQKLLPARNVD